MIFIYKDLIISYIKRLTPKDLEEFAKKKNIIYTNNELDIVYSFIKDNYLELLNQNIRVFEKIRDKISPNLYKELINLYIDYKEKLISN